MQQAQAMGYTRKVYLEAGCTGFEALIRPDQDLDDQYRCWDIDSGEWVTVKGWNVECEDVE